MGEYSEKINIKEIRIKILNLIIPITIDRVLQMTAAMVSAAMISRISTPDYAGMSLSMRITQIIFAAFNGLAVGTTVFVAQSYGAKDYKKLSRIIQQSMLSFVILVLVFQQILFWNASALLHLLFNPLPDLMKSSVDYLKIVSWGLPFQIIMLTVSASLQGMGNTKTPMIITAMMNLVNLALSYMLIFGHLGFPAMGVEGAALALAIAQFVGAMLGLWVLFNKSGVLSHLLNKNFFRFDIKQIFSLYRVGIPSSVEQLLWQIAAIILTRIILKFGDTTLAAHNLGMQAESISYMPAFGFSVAATTFVGQCLGAGKGELGKTYLKEAVKGSIIITSIAVIFLVFFPRQLMSLLTPDKAVINLGAYYLIIMGLVEIPQNLAGVFGGALRGAGFTKIPMITALSGLWGIRVPFTILFYYVFKFNIIAIWTTMGADLIFRFLLSYFLYKRKNIYKAKLVIENLTVQE